MSTTTTPKLTAHQTDILDQIEHRAADATKFGARSRRSILTFLGATRPKTPLCEMREMMGLASCWGCDADVCEDVITLDDLCSACARKGGS